MFVERALAGWEIETLVRGSEDGLLKRETVIPLLIHPGYEVLTCLLTNSPLQSTILSYIIGGIEGFERKLPSEELYFLLTIIGVLRIIHRVLEIQDVFLNVLIPILSEFDSAPLVGSVRSRSFYMRFDQALTYRTKYILAIAAYVVDLAYPELVLLAVKIVSQLSSSTSVTSLLTLVEHSPDSERILSGFRQLLDVKSLDDIDVVETLLEQTTGTSAADRKSQELLDQAIRVAIPDPLVRNTKGGMAYLNIRHFLLFGGAESEHQIQDPHAIGACRMCAYVILDVVNVGVPRMRAKGKDRERARKAMVHAEPLFNVLSALIPEASQEPFIEVMYHDRSHVLASMATLHAFIDLHSRILDFAALDLHVQTNRGHHKSVLAILQILFGMDNMQDRDGSDASAHHQVCAVVVLTGRTRSRPPPLTWSISGHSTCMPVRVDATGCKVVDQLVLLSLLTSACRTLHSQACIMTTAQVEKLNAEMAYILESCRIENHRRQVTYAVASGYKVWRQLLDMTLTKCFHRLPHNRREDILFDLLHVLPGIVCSNVQQGTAVLLSEAILSTIAKLCKDRSIRSCFSLPGATSRQARYRPSGSLGPIVYGSVFDVADGAVLAEVIVDQDSFLPCAIQRYHQLFMLALQLVVAMLASLGMKHTTTNNQALELLSSHRDTIVIMLKNDSEEVALSYIEEIHLLIIFQLPSSMSVTNLLMLVEHSSNSEHVLSGFRQLLDVDSLDDVDASETLAEQIMGAGMADRECQEPLDQAMRVAILIFNPQHWSQDYPNIGSNSRFHPTQWISYSHKWLYDPKWHPLNLLPKFRKSA
ncbi:hypothetical protein HD554DRAFT_2039038 [Boletus coccyginus]|nr:hypothetical protein HD554DRAFT_2039038 [Boletus coccyginus]